jgi:hypothetical protein
LLQNKHALQEAAFSQLVNDISEDLLKSEKAFLLSSLLDKMFSYLPEHVPKDLIRRVVVGFFFGKWICFN